ncbi:MAG: alanine racemase [Actinobacteria bacterium]|nr:alanine racemase [Actinomycetota bacterium]
MAELTAAAVGAALERVRSRIADAGGDPSSVTVVAVTKGFGAEAVTAALEAGCTDIGENYAAELLDKAPATAGARIHFLGGIQRNKIARLAPVVHVWQSVDRLEVAESLSRRAPGAEILVQVDLLDGAVAGRSGVSVADVPGFVASIRDLGLDVRGLMAMGPPPPENPLPGFRRVADLRQRLGLSELSLGMTSDLEAAVEAGSTMVRVGTALFGPRPKAR